MSEAFKKYVIYQIYPRSFCDSNGDGIGDLNGIAEKLPYIKLLGADAICLSPIYCSPNEDYGFDISDYKDINPEFGTMKDFEKLIKTAHATGLKVITEIVINHTSDKHKWFEQSSASKNNPYRDYYIWREGKGKEGNQPPNNWTSFFGGGAWSCDGQTNEWYLHLFGKNQPDLNFENAEVKREFKEIFKFWLDKGVDGFCLNKFSVVGKNPELPGGKPMTAVRGIESFNYQPETNEILKEFKELFDKYNCLIVGEGVFANVLDAAFYTGGEGSPLDLVMNAPEQLYGVKRFGKKFNFRKFKESVCAWQQGMFEKGWSGNCFENCNQPRITGHYCSDKKYLTESAKMMGALLLTLTGTPYIFQGQEIGMTNPAMTDLPDYRDEETKCAYKELRKGLKGEKRAIRLISQTSRDNARTPMQWSSGKYAGFSVTHPWIKLNPNYPQINVELQDRDVSSTLNFYRSLIELRKENDALVFGEYIEYLKNHGKLLMFEKRLKEKRMLAVFNFSDDFTNFKVPKKQPEFVSSELVLSNMPYSSRELQNIILRPYEALIYELK